MTSCWYNAKISRWNIRRTEFQNFTKLIASTENQNSPIAVPVGLIFLLAQRTQTNAQNAK